jgi:hypothetical protein
MILAISWVARGRHLGGAGWAPGTRVSRATHWLLLALLLACHRVSVMQQQALGLACCLRQCSAVAKPCARTLLAGKPRALQRGPSSLCAAILELHCGPNHQTGIRYHGLLHESYLAWILCTACSTPAFMHTHCNAATGLLLAEPGRSTSPGLV